MTGAQDSSGFGDTQLEAAWASTAPPRHPWGQIFGNPGRVAGVLGLCWLAYPVSALLGSHRGTGHKVVVLFLAATFAVVILRMLFSADGDRVSPPPPGEFLRLTGGIALIDVALALGDRPEWAAVMTVYVIALVVMVDPTARGGALALVIIVAAYGLMTAGGWDASQAGPQALTMIAVGVTLMAMGWVVRANHELRAARAELARVAVADERRRFARDVHDLLGHSLSLIAIKADLAQRVQASDPERAARELADIERAARTSLSEVRAALSGYRRATIAGELVGVRAALESAGVSLQTRMTRMALDAEDEAVLAWALREATTNVVRHAGASNVLVRLEPAGPGARLEVEDDGRGRNGAAGGSGLRGLAERVAARDGRLETGDRPGGGFRLAVELPGTILA